MEGPQHRRQDSERDINDLLLNGYYKTSRARSPSASIPSTSRTPSFANAPSFLHTVEDSESPRRSRNTLDPEQAQRRSRNTLEAENRELTRHRSRSRSRAPRPPTGPPPPKPTCEDEAESLARELSSTSVLFSDDETPMRGVIEQYPVILEAEVTVAEEARLHAEPRKKEDDTSSDNGERRFVFIPRADTHSPTREDGYGKIKDDRTESDRDSTSSQDQAKRENKRPYIPTQPFERPKQRPEPDWKDSHRTSLPAQPVERSKPTPDLVREEKKLPLPGPPPLERRRSSRQDLPALKTKEIPPQFRRTASAYASTAVEPDILKSTPRTPRTASEYMLSPDVITSGRGGKGYFDSVASPRHHSNLYESSVPYTNGDTRSSGSSFSGASRPATPNEKEKRASGSFDTRRNTSEKMTRPQQLTAENGAQRHLRTHSTHSEAPASPRASEHSLRHYYSSSDDEVLHSSDSERRRRRHDRHHDHHKHSLRPVDEYNRPRRSPSSTRKNPFDAKVSSRYSSPLPSPNVSPSQIQRGDQFENNRSETFPRASTRRLSSRPVSPNTPVVSNDTTPRASELNLMDAPPRLKSRQPSGNVPKLPSAAVSQTSLPLPIPTTPHVRSPIASQYNEPKSPSVRTPGEGKSYWQPPAFQPPTSSTNLEKPVGSFRRYSEDIERGSVAPLPTCPRTAYSRDHQDWLTLPQLKGFDICPSCYNSTMAKTEFRNHFIPAPRRPPDVEIICDFGSSPWYRIAWLLTLKERRRDLGLFYGLTEIATSVQPCLGKHDAIRQWHSIIDPRTGHPIRNFDVCTSCVKSVETLLPAIRGVFVRTDSHPTSSQRVCDLRFDSKRFIKYFDALETTANSAEELDCAPDTREIAELAKHMSLIDECQHDVDVLDRRWYIITQLPEFTVCDECYDEVIYPLEQEKRKAIPAMFTKSSTRIPRASCQLYSPRMREVFENAVQTDDYRYLASKARERKTVELAYKANVADLKWRINNSGGLDSIGANSAVSRELNRLTEEWRKWE